MILDMRVEKLEFRVTRCSIPSIGQQFRPSLPRPSWHVWVQISLVIVDIIKPCNFLPLPKSKTHQGNHHKRDPQPVFDEPVHIPKRQLTATRRYISLPLMMGLALRTNC
jgi:hypothetical protein